tara:strand:+ start:2312 stop:2443 length:132 start_codon:yes stop_codon:yes gene_type:complete
MIEYIKHLLGLCGEPHGLIYYIFAAGGISTLFIYLKTKMFKNG